MFSPSMSVAAYDNGIPYDAVYDNSGPNGAALYEGQAYPGIADTAGNSFWRIRKFFFDVNGTVMGWRWANSSTAFDKDWTLRSGYTYIAL